jgi:hypothetical protein
MGVKFFIRCTDNKMNMASIVNVTSNKLAQDKTELFQPQ